MYYAIYSETAGPKSFATARDDLMFAPQVMYNGKTFRLDKMYIVTTPSEHKQFQDYCTRMNCELDVQIS